MVRIKNLATEKFKDLRAAVRLGGKSRFIKLFHKLHPRDRARYIFDQDLKTRKKLFTYLTIDDTAKLFESIDLDERIARLIELPPRQTAEILGKMNVDDAVDVLNSLEPSKSANYMSIMDPIEAQEIAGFLQYEEETAGSIMTTEFVAVNEAATAVEALEILKQEAAEAVTIYYVFVTNDDGQLLKVVSLKELILASKDTLVGELGRDHVIKVTADAAKLEPAQLMAEYNFLALPVVDSQNRLIGVITVDDIVDVISEDMADDYSKLAAISDVELTDAPFDSARKRLPWLILLLFMGMVTATLIGQFEDTIAKVAILGAFIPVVAGTTGNSGTQSLAIVVRGIATGKLDELSLRKYFIKEFITALATGIVCGVVLASIIFVWKGQLFIGLVAGVSLAMSILIGTLSGSAVPLLMRKLKIDPAVASGPLITTICDIISMAIYFGVATLLLTQLT